MRQDAAERIVDWIAQHVNQVPAPLPQADEKAASPSRADQAN